MWKVVVVVRGIFEHVKGPKTNVEYNFLGASKSFLMVMYVSLFTYKIMEKAFSSCDSIALC